jgi:hypothetical protein
VECLDAETSASPLVSEWLAKTKKGGEREERERGRERKTGRVHA